MLDNQNLKPSILNVGNEMLNVSYFATCKQISHCIVAQYQLSIIKFGCIVNKSLTLLLSFFSYHQYLQQSLQMNMDEKIPHKPSIDGKYIGRITSDFIQVADRLKEAAYVIQNRGGFEYPIFITSPIPIALGALLIDKEKMGNQGYYYAAYLDLLVQHGYIAIDKIDYFKSTYKDSSDYCCLLVIDTANELYNFLYLPYPID